MSAVRAGPLVALLVLGLLFVAASWVDAGMAAAPDPHPSAKPSRPAPAPDPYQTPAPSEPESSQATQPVTETVTRVETTPSTGTATGTTTRAPAQPTTDSASGARTQKKAEKAPEKASDKTVATQRPRLNEPARLAVPAATDGRPLLLGGLAMIVLALASGSMLFLVTRSSGAGIGRWEAKP
jgi:cytoskeletal protein RodZ